MSILFPIWKWNRYFSKNISILINKKNKEINVNKSTIEIIESTQSPEFHIFATASHIDGTTATICGVKPIGDSYQYLFLIQSNGEETIREEGAEQWRIVNYTPSGAQIQQKPVRKSICKNVETQVILQLDFFESK